ncbi:MAG: S8 family serine peptidase [Desulfobulbaceae bacterium]|nr:S8 family serine peptidase [Desulfobulbaceae bacterium]
MEHIIKIFCSGSDQDQLADSYETIERYDGFMLIKVDKDQLEEIARRYPVEDITELYTIRVGEHTLDTSKPRVDVKGKLRTHPDYKGVKRLAPGHHHHLVQFIGPIKEAWLAEVKKMGGEPRAPFEGFSYIVRGDDKTLARITALPFVRWVGHLRHDDRIASSVITNIGRKAGDVTSELPRTRVLPGVYTIEFFDKSNMKAAQSGIKDIGFEILEQEAEASIIVIRDPKTGKGRAKRIRDLSAVHGVRFIHERSLKRTSNDVAARIMGTSSTLGDPGLGLSGAGEVIAVCDTGLDTGDPQNIHSDFAGRVSWIKSYPVTADLSPYIDNPGGNDGPADLDSGHGTHVAGSVLGDGSASIGLSGVNTAIRGLAHKAKLAFQAVEQEMQWKNPADLQRYGRYLLTGIPNNLRTLFADAYAENARIHSNSWGGGDPGVYDNQSEQLDRFVWEHKDFCVVVAAGNDGTDNDGDGAINPMSVTSPATAKNCICVGACENERPTFNSNTYGNWWPQDYPVAPYRNDPMANNPEQVVAFSSRGPTQDGRVKPEVIAPGTFILSTRSSMIALNNTAWSSFSPSRSYFYMGGTSMATPLTAGGAALIREYLRKKQQISNPSAALIKSVMITGAHRLPGYGAAGDVYDNDQGYGRVNLDAILAPSAPAKAEFQQVAPGLRTGEVYSTEIKVKSSDVPLRVVMTYSDYPGPALVNNLNLILTAPDGTRFVGNQAAGTLLNLDTKNNVEVADIVNPAPGTWLAEVVASNIPQGPQDFALVYLAHVGELPSAVVIQAEDSPNLTIPDNKRQGIGSDITISQPGVISSIKVGVDITHTYIGDLRVTLTAPDGTDIVLHDRHGASADNILKTYDVHTIPELTVVTGKAVQGDWRLSISDHARRDIGKLRRWNLEIAVKTAEHIRKESEPSLAIPDNNPAGISDTIDIDQSGTVRDITVWVDITHTWIGDLQLELISPSGTAVILHDQSGGSRDNIIQTYDVQSLTALQSFIGEEGKGIWTLKASDHAGRDVGKMNRWGLEISL